MRYDESEGVYETTAAREMVTTEDARPIPTQAARLGRNLASLSETVERLDDRLGCVMRPAPPTATPDKMAGADHQPSSDMTDQLERAADMVYRLDGAIERLIGRLEL